MLGKENSIIRAEKSGIGAPRIGQKNQVRKLSGCDKKNQVEKCRIGQTFQVKKLTG